MSTFVKSLALALAIATPVAAQQTTNYPPASFCKTITVNAKGSANADIVIDATSGGVRVMDASTNRCSSIIRNSSANDMRCAPITLTVSATAGTLISAGAALTIGIEGQQAWNCIRTGGSNAAANVTESAP